MKVLYLLLGFSLLASAQAFGGDGQIAAPAAKQAALYYPGRLENDLIDIVSPFDGLITALPARFGSALRRGERVALISNDNPAFSGQEQPVVAPSTSVLQFLSVRLGQRVKIGDKLMTLSLPTKRLVVELTASDANLVKLGQKAEFTPVGHTSPAFGKVSGLSPTSDPITSTVRCEIELVPDAVMTLVGGTIGATQILVAPRLKVSAR